MLRLTNVVKNFGDRPILRGISLTLPAGQKVALVGPNGVGKSTLMRVIVGTEPYDSGVLRTDANWTTGFLPQDAGVRSNRPLWDEMFAAFPEILAVNQELREIEKSMETAHGDDLDRLVERQGDLYDEFDRLGGYTVEADAHAVLAGLGFSQDDYTKRALEFSGGWQMRIALAKLLVRKPNLILLDEPTNHLDARATEWLEEYFASYPGAAIIVSHDRKFLDRVISRVFELEDGLIHDYNGNYTAFEAEKKRRVAARAAAYSRQQKFIKRQQDFINRFRANARRASLVRSRERMLARLEREAVPPTEPDTMKLKFGEGHPMPAELIVAEDMAKAYGDRTIVSDVNLRIIAGQRIALVGPNGAGKSTILRVLAGIDEPTAGTVRRATVGYFAQDQSQTLDETRTVVQEILANAPAEWGEERARGLLGRFQFSRDTVYKMTGALSGGEKSRLSLAKLLLKPVHVLVMDEPTNHLDVRTRATLIEAMQVFKGAILFASHDPDLLEALATHVLDVRDGKAVLHTTDYAGFKERLEAAAEEEEVEEDARVLELEDEIEHLQQRREALEEALEALQGEAKVASQRDHAEVTSRLVEAEAELEALALAPA
ncbi:MAG: ABC-F family ATP-binding cassette domain-containing protein [Chloroflexota bacterium]|nr:MAG: ABC-F family ATP-binding cassette domain-containing protein [Chloroflexota bacterium]